MLLGTAQRGRLERCHAWLGPAAGGLSLFWRAAASGVLGKPKVRRFEIHPRSQIYPLRVLSPLRLTAGPPPLLKLANTCFTLLY
jgi:hypothetical protein